MTVSVLLEGHLIEGARDGFTLDGKIQADKDVQWIPKNRFNLQRGRRQQLGHH